MSESLELVVRALRSEHRVLVLGQHYLLDGSGTDPLAVAIGLTSAYDQDSQYDWWLRDDRMLEQRVKYLAGLSDVVSTSAEVESLMRRPWKVVVTSAIDRVVTRLLTVSARRQVHEEVQPGYGTHGAAMLKLVRLFGSVGRPSASEWPPADGRELRQRRGVASEMLFPIGELATPSGAVFIDGWDPTPGSDWLRPQELSRSLLNLAPNQAFIFGISEPQRRCLEADEDFQYLIEAGIVRTYQDRLSQVIAVLEAGDDLTDLQDLLLVPDTVYYSVTPTVPVKFRGAAEEDLVRLPIPQSDWQRLSETFTIIEPINVAKPLPVSSEDRYSVFRDFLGSRPESSWSWIQTLAFRRRVYESEIRAQILSVIRERAPQEHVIVVHGQSASGKSVLLNLLAVDLRTAGLPIIYAGSRIAEINRSHIDEFCMYIEGAVRLQSTNEDVGNRSVVPVIVIYDGMQEVSDYQKLATYLAGRGRKCLIVGSSYSIDMSRSSSQTFSQGNITIHSIPLEVRMEDEERGLLLHHIETFVEGTLALLERIPASRVDSFFAFLHWILPATKHNIEQSIVGEIEFSVERFNESLRHLVEQYGNEYSATSAMEGAFRRVLGDELEAYIASLSTDDSSGATFENRDGLSIEESKAPSSVSLRGMQLINAVMLSSDLGLPIPQELCLRLISRDNALYSKVTRSASVITEDFQTGSYTITLSARHPLEAEIWVERNLSSAKQKLDLIEQIVGVVYESEMDDQHSPTLNYVVRLLQSVGPQGDQRRQLKDHFYDLAKLVQSLRQRFSAVNPRLLLVECNCTREWVQVQQREFEKRAFPSYQERIDELRRLMRHEWMPLLETAQATAEMARDIVTRNAGRLSDAARRFLAVIGTERSAIIGVQLGSLLSLANAEGEADQTVIKRSDEMLKVATTAWRESLKFDDENYRAFDVACWILEDRFAISKLADAADEVDDSARQMALIEQSQLLAEWQDMIDRYLGLSIPSSAKENRNKRVAEFTMALGNPDRFETVAEQAAAQGSMAPRVLMARWIEEHISDEEAINYLHRHCGPKLLTDRTVLLLYSRLWWKTETGLESFFPTERMRLAFSFMQWEHLGELSQALLQLEGESANGAALFHLGWSKIQMGRTNEGSKVFHELDLLNIGGPRRSRALSIISDEQGNALQFNGDIRGLRGNRGFVWVEPLRMQLPFNVAEFGLLDPRNGDDLGPFHVALNYRGPYAEPLRRLAISEASRSRSVVDD